jgi:hypothetical protein
VVALAAVAAFVLALLLGWQTSPRREDLRKPSLLGQAPAVPRLKVLGAAAAFPDAPPKRHSIVVVKPPPLVRVGGSGGGKIKALPPLPPPPPVDPTGKLISGSG